MWVLIIARVLGNIYAWRKVRLERSSRIGRSVQVGENVHLRPALWSTIDTGINEGEVGGEVESMQVARKVASIVKNVIVKLELRYLSKPAQWRGIR
jgi:hypothetical protein